MTLTNPPTRKVRTAKLSDLSFIDTLQKTWRNNVGWIPKSTLKRYVAAKQLIVIDENGQPAGYLNWCPNRKGLITVPQVAIHPELLRTSCGTEILTRLKTAATLHSCSALRLSSRGDLLANLFWPTLGFKNTAILSPNSARKLPIYEWTLQLDQPIPGTLHIDGLRKLDDSLLRELAT